MTKEMGKWVYEKRRVLTVYEKQNIVNNLKPEYKCIVIDCEQFTNVTRFAKRNRVVLECWWDKEMTDVNATNNKHQIYFMDSEYF